MRHSVKGAAAMIAAAVMIVGAGIESPAVAAKPPTPPPARSTPLICLGGTQIVPLPGAPTPPVPLGGTCTTEPGGRASIDFGDYTPGSGQFGFATFWVDHSGLTGQKLSQVKSLSFDFTNPSPQGFFTIPVDVNGDGAVDGAVGGVIYRGPLTGGWEHFAANACGDASDTTSGTVDVIHSAACQNTIVAVDPGTGTLVNDTFANWAALVAAYPNVRVAEGPYQASWNYVRPYFYLAGGGPGDEAVDIANVRMGSARGSTF